MAETPVVLIVDDSDAICLVLHVALAGLGFAPLVATSCREATEHVEHVGLSGLALAVLDVHVEGDADGYALGEQWRAECPRLPIVLMSGAPHASSLPAVAAGWVPLVAKPFDLDTLIPYLATLAESRSDE